MTSDVVSTNGTLSSAVVSAVFVSAVYALSPAPDVASDAFAFAASGSVVSVEGK